MPTERNVLLELLSALVTLYVVYKTTTPNSGSDKAAFWYYTSRGLGHTAGFVGHLALKAEAFYWKNI